MLPESIGLCSRTVSEMGGSVRTRMCRRAKISSDTLIGSFDRIGENVRDRALEVEFRYRFVGARPGRDIIREYALLALS
jgi:hypothetical protein